MKTLREELDKVLAIKDEAACAQAFQQFCKMHADSLPLPGEDTQFDKAVWAASKFMSLSNADESILHKVTAKLLGSKVESMTSAVLKLKDLVGSGREAAIATWQEMLAAMSWQQMVPAGALRGVGSQMVSLGSFERKLADAHLQVNLGWLVEEQRLKVLLQATDSKQQALPAVELRIRESGRGVVFSRQTNQDGTVVAPGVEVGPGQYKIEIAFDDQIAETPHFII